MKEEQLIIVTTVKILKFIPVFEYLQILENTEYGYNFREQEECSLVWIWKCRKMSSFSWAKILLKCKPSRVPSCWHHTSQLIEQKGGFWTCQMVQQVHHLVFDQYEMIGMLLKTPWLKQSYKADLYVPSTALDLSLMSTVPFHQRRLMNKFKSAQRTVRET